MITGDWTGRINRQKVEIKIIQNGDSLAGTSYYYESSTHFRRYNIKGYFDPQTNAAIWWDDQLIEDRTNSGPGNNALMASADFNCPGGAKMMLDGKASLLDDPNKPRGDIHLDKTNQPLFNDEWDYVIDNYTTGANDPDIIDSIGQVAIRPDLQEPVTPIPQLEKPVRLKPVVTKTKVVTTPTVLTAEPDKQLPPYRKPSIEEKFTSRKNILTTEIPLSGDSIELRFYDNAEIDGDSISLFLNDKLIFEHIRLEATAYTIKIAISDLKDSNDLIMVAENLGAIPPNTSYMVAMVNGKKYDARLESTEGTSAMIRLFKPPVK